MAIYNVSYEWSVVGQPDEFHHYAGHTLVDIPDDLSGMALLDFLERRIKENAALIAHVKNLTILS